MTGLTGDQIHLGAGVAGIPLPDVGLTELISNITGGSRTAQGGSNLVGASSANTGYTGPIASYPMASYPQPTTGGGAGGGATGGGGTGGTTTGDPNAGKPGYFYDSAHGWVPIGASTGGGDMASQISEAYQPALNALGEYQNAVQSGYEGDVSNVGQQYANTQQATTAQGQQLETSTNQEQDAFNKMLSSAYDDAVRAYNALKQQGINRFGGASSAGQAVGELAQQEFARQQGKTAQQGLQGTQQFATERTKIKNYISQKMNDLDTWKNTALNDLKKNLNDSLANIAMRRGDIEANKTKDKLAALQSAVQQSQQIASTDRQFRQQLALAAVNQLQTVSGRVFTPQEWGQYFNEVMATLAPGLPSVIGQTTVSPTAANATSAYAQLARKKAGTDELNQTNTLPGTTQGTT